MSHIGAQKMGKGIHPKNMLSQPALLTTIFTNNSSDLKEVILELRGTLITSFGVAAQNCNEHIIFKVCFQTAYRICHQNSAGQAQYWILELQNQQIKINLRSCQLHHAEKWDAILKNKMSRIGFWDRYRPVRRISKGEFSAVYEVARISDKKKFAVKAFTRSYFQQHSECLIGLEKEVEMLREVKSLQFQHLLGLEDIYSSQSAFYLIIQLCGRDLVSGFSTISGCRQTKTKTAMQQILSALDKLHSNRIVHRDLKPSNIMFKHSKQLEVTISDFGLSTRQQLDHPYLRCGTPGYVAPQIFSLKQTDTTIDTASDMFSLGAIFYLLLTGEALFKGESKEDLIKKNSRLQYDMGPLQSTLISNSSKDLLFKLLAKDPKDRIKARDALLHQYFCQPIKIRSPALTFESYNFLANNDLEFSDIEIGASGRKRQKGQYRKASER